MIGKNMAIFYPEGFKASEMLPSMALLKEPVEEGAIPSGWKVFPDFYVDKDGHNCIRIPIEKGTDLYGTGEVTGSLRRNGKSITLWNTDNYTYKKSDGKVLYQSHPWIMAVRKDGSAYGILVDNTWKQEIDLTDTIKVVSYGPASRVIVIERKSPQLLTEALAKLTGTMEMPPLWALGYQQCRWSYYPDTRVKEVASEFRKLKIPCDVIWMDIHYMQDYKIFTFDSLRFPDPAGLNGYLHSINFKSVWMIDPGVKKEKGYFVYDQGEAGNYWVQDSTGKEFNGDVWPGPCAFPDFTMPQVRKWWEGLYKDYMALGIDGVWNDMNEPSVFKSESGTMPEDNIHRGGDGLPEDVHLRYHNVYGMLMVKATREGILKANPDKRPFVLSRANYLGGQRYAATWTGDNTATWKQFEMSIPMVLNLGLSGQPFSGPDIGGFAGSPTKELFANWMAVGAFYPFCRDHTEKGSADQEPWAFGKEVENVSRTAIERRYRLLPYFYTLFYKATQTGLPVMRPVFFADPKDTRLRREDRAFLLGKDLLVIPKWTKDPALPKGIWNSISLVGENSQKDPYQPDLRQRGGSIIPLTKVIQSTVDFRTDSLTLLICFNKKGKAKGTMYSDAGDGFGYKKGEYAINRFKAKESADGSISFSSEKTEGEYDNCLKHYRIGIVTPSGIVYSGWYDKNEFTFNIKKQ
jgi:alpha-glucosidase